MIRILTCLMMLALPVLPAQAQKQESVNVGGKQAFLHVPANARASAVLVPGRGGIDPSDPLLRNRAALNAAGIATLTVPHSIVIGQALQYMRKVKEPVGLVGMSAGVSWAARGVGNGGGKDPCGPNSAHGFMGADGQVVGAIVGFIAR